MMLAIRSAMRHRPYLLLTRQDAPSLFDLVDRVATWAGAPRLTRIEVDWTTSASAGFLGGLRGVWEGRLVLRLGLPILAGLSSSQLAGVVVHELGHFRQRAGMRLFYLVRSVLGWFERANESLSRDYLGALVAIPYLGGIFFLARRITIFFARLMLAVVAGPGRLVSSLVTRQMELDADRLEAHLVGSETFKSTMYRLRCLSAATQTTLQRRAQKAEGLLECISACSRSLPLDALFDVEFSITKARTAWLDDHPSDSDRIATICGEDTVGVLLSDDPASALFADFSMIVKRATAELDRAQCV
jgi:Zn-dependent protease with chaperone function